jgi:transcriptional regulator of met regulon
MKYIYNALHNIPIEKQTSIYINNYNHTTNNILLCREYYHMSHIRNA